ncbi:MAG: hypothetical protein JWL91_1084 [Sphingomonas bacterium]|nr:hypothetical protein [Sphingomonas bacterium]
MDLSFVCTPGRGAGAGMFPAATAAMPGLAFAQLAASVGAVQCASRTAQVAARLRAGVTDVRAEGFVALLGPGGAWIAGMVAPFGSFHPGVARRSRPAM